MATSATLKMPVRTGPTPRFKKSTTAPVASADPEVADPSARGEREGR